MKRPRNPIDGRRETVIRVRLVPRRYTITVDWGTEPDYFVVSYFTAAGEYLGSEPTWSTRGINGLRFIGERK